MRGKVPRSSVILDCVRITPAYAGKSYKLALHASWQWDHPRLCGEKRNISHQRSCGTGSPPPMRGKVLQYHVFSPVLGITPAYAGKRFGVPLCILTGEDHPRLCGEKVEMLQSRRRYAGSPPPMRGKAACATPTDRITGITPAYAGKSVTQPHTSVFPRDHPRLCGEKPVDHGDSVHSRGSPPPMRGKVLQCGICGRKVGITPAYAGKSRRRLFRGERCEDHPRLCGEKEADVQFLWHPLGSPPPMRGKALRQRDYRSRERITPAYAGKSSKKFDLSNCK